MPPNQVSKNYAHAHLPPLKGLEAFVTAARAGSFTEAGKVLGLSPSTLSRRIRSLEDHWGETLFHRGGACVRLTAAGKAYLAAAERAFQALLAIGAEARQSERTTVSITAPQIFVSLFIAPHLSEFEQDHPDINLVIDTSPHVADLYKEDFDLAIRYGIGGWHELEAERIFVMCGGPVCAPELKDGQPLPRTVGDLADHTLLHFSQAPESWARFFTTMGHKGLRGRTDRYFDDAELLYAAACQGMGVALAAPEFIRPLLESGMLVRPTGVDMGTGAGFFFVFAPGRRSHPAIRRFCNWVLSLESVRELREKQKRYGF